MEDFQVGLPLSFHNMEGIMAWMREDFGKPSYTKKEQTFMRVKICIFMYLYVIIVC